MSRRKVKSLEHRDAEREARKAERKQKRRQGLAQLARYCDERDARRRARAVGRAAAKVREQAERAPSDDGHGAVMTMEGAPSAPDLAEIPPTADAAGAPKGYDNGGAPALSCPESASAAGGYASSALAGAPDLVAAGRDDGPRAMGAMEGAAAGDEIPPTADAGARPAAYDCDGAPMTMENSAAASPRPEVG